MIIMNLIDLHTELFGDVLTDFANLGAVHDNIINIFTIANNNSWLPVFASPLASYPCQSSQLHK